VNLSGVTISSVSLHNEDLILEKDIRIGDTVIVERAGDVIPYIVGPVKDKRNGKEKRVRFPEKCPSCHTALVRPEGEAHWRCINAACPAQVEEHLIHFASKGAMDINRLGRDIIGRFIDEGFLRNLADIYKLDFEKIAELDRWSDVSATNLRRGIEASKQQPLWRLIVGLGIRHVGTTTAKMLAKHVDDIRQLADWTIDRLTDLEDVGPKVAESIHDFFHNPENIRLIKELQSRGVNTRRTEADRPTGGVLFGKTFLFTGSLTRFTRDQAKELVERNGGRILSSVSPKLDYLVVGESPGSKLKKAQEVGVNVIDEEGFLGMIS
jgi:DNA ligase (NAD+)